jgi:hypothetical protein
MHGGKFGKELMNRINRNPRLVVENSDDLPLQRAVLYLSERRFWSDGYGLTLPKWMRHPATSTQGVYAAARVSAFLASRLHWHSKDFEGDSEILCDAMKTENDPFLRSWFEKLADELDEVGSRDPFSFERFVNEFGRRFSQEPYDTDEYEADMSYEDEYGGADPDCTCPDCRAARGETTTGTGDEPSWID